MKNWISNHTIYSVVAGSRLYGTSHENSDTDIRNVCLDPPQTLIGISDRMWQEESISDEEDSVTYGVAKFMSMCLNANPSILDILFAPRDTWEFSTPVWEFIYNNRCAFLSTRVRNTFTGYARSQLKRMTKHHEWIETPPSRPDPAMFGLELLSLDKGVQKYVEIQEKYKFISGWKIDTRAIKRALKRRSVYKPTDRDASIAAFRDAERDYLNYLEWVSNRNEKRATLEASYGYDTKHAGHLARLLIKGEEILSTGVYNPVLHGDQKDFVLGVMGGTYEYGELLSWADEASKRIMEMPTSLGDVPSMNVYYEILYRTSAMSIMASAELMKFINGE